MADGIYAAVLYDGEWGGLHRHVRMRASGVSQRLTDLCCGVAVSKRRVTAGS